MVITKDILQDFEAKDKDLIDAIKMFSLQIICDRSVAKEARGFFTFNYSTLFSVRNES